MADPQELLAALTETELEVLRLMAEGLSYDEIADARMCALSTVKTHAAHIRAKLETPNRRQAVRLYRKSSQKDDAG